MEREYIRIKPSREQINPFEIVRMVDSLRDLQKTETSGLLKRTKTVDPTFEFLAVSEGHDEPVRFYFGTDPEFIEEIESDIETAYPNSFDIEREFIDLERVLVPRLKYSLDEYLEDFGDRITEWEATNGAVAEDLLVDKEQRELRVRDDQTPDLPGTPELVIDDGGDYLLAQPELEHISPLVCEWYGVGDWDRDWTTLLKKLTDLLTEVDDDEIIIRFAIARLIQQIVKTELPCAFQVLFKRKPNWHDIADERRRNLHLRKETAKQSAFYELGELLHGSSRERRDEKRRDYFQREGEAVSRHDRADVGEAGERTTLMDDKDPGRTYTVNIQAAVVATRRVPIEQARERLTKFKHVLSHLAGQHYRVTAELVENKQGLLGEKKLATASLKRMLDRELVIHGNGKMMRDVVMNADELANVITVPPASGLTVEGSRKTRAKPKSRNPLPLPSHDIMEYFRKPGLRIGRAIGEDGIVEDEPVQVAADLLRVHLIRAAMTNAGKTIALINDALSAYENTRGPTIVIAPKGDEMCENLLRVIYKRHGWNGEVSNDDRLNGIEDCYYFPMPKVLPGFSFFDRRSILDHTDTVPEIAAQQKAEFYEQILKLAMGTDRYEESKVAPIIIKTLIQVCFDEREWASNGENRESPDYFSHHDLEKVIEQFRKAVSSRNNGEDTVPLPATSDRRLYESMERHLDSTFTDFSPIMSAVDNRVDYIRTDINLRRIFDNTDRKFDFLDLLQEDCLILFDLGDLQKDESKLVMAGLILANLYEAAQSSGRQGEDFPDDHVINLIIDESATVAVSDLMSKMLDRGRGFGLSVELAMQYPGQMRAISEKAYQSVLNSAGSKLFGKIPLDKEIPEVLAHENMDAKTFQNRIRSLPRGEWIAELPDPEFGKTGPEPFSLAPMPIPAGHPESDNPLTEAEERKFSEVILPDLLKRMMDTVACNQEYLDGVPALEPDHVSAIETAGDDRDTEDDDPGSRSGGGPPDEGDDFDSIGSKNAFKPANDESAAERRSQGSLEGASTEPSTEPVSTELTDESDESSRVNEDNSSDDDEEDPVSTVDDPPPFLTDPEVDEDLSQPDLPEEHRSKGDGSYNPSDDGFDPVVTDDDQSIEPSRQSSPHNDLDSTNLIREEQNVEDAIGGDWTEDAVVGYACDVTEAYWHDLDRTKTLLGTVARLAQSQGLQLSLDTPPLSDLVRAAQDGQVQAVVAGIRADLDGSSSSSDLDENQPMSDNDESITDRSEAGSFVDPYESNHREYDLSKPQAGFLKTIIDAINGDIEYAFHIPMTQFREQKELLASDITYLEQEGFIKTEKLLGRGMWYSPTKKAEQAVGTSIEHHQGHSDLGEELFHKVGVHVVAEYLRTLPDVDTVYTYYDVGKQGDPAEIVDVYAVDQDGNPVYVAEYEHGTDTGATTQNTDAIVDDFDKLAAIEGATSIWVMRNRSTIKDIVGRLQDADRLPPDLTWRGTQQRLREDLEVDPEAVPGMNVLHSLSEVWSLWDAARKQDG